MGVSATLSNRMFAAAKNIGGLTLHNTLGFCFEHDVYTVEENRSSTLQSYRVVFLETPVIIIDEISLVDAT